MVSRRSVLTGGVSALAGSATILASLPAVSQQVGYIADSVEDFGFVGPQDDPEFGEAIAGKRTGSAQPVGTGQARHEEVSTAFRLLYDAPRGADHLAIARYFEAIQEKNREGELYNREWRERANPLIVGFFSMTNTLPAVGDETKWCAAFVSFVLNAAYKPNQFSALSGGYRSYSDATENPRPGDIVVFQNAGENGRKGFGHVGFYVSSRGPKIEVLGGNQRGNTGSTGAVTVATYDANEPSLRLHSFRRVPD